jgi:hypothetical protein
MFVITYSFVNLFMIYNFFACDVESNYAYYSSSLIRQTQYINNFCSTF